MGKINLLDEWYKNAFVASSSLNPSKTFSRDIVSFIYKQLVSFFGENYFAIKVYENRPIDRQSWLFYNLVNWKNAGAMFSLYETATLISYAQSLDQSIQKILQSLKKSPVTLRSFFFELYIYHFLDGSFIENKKKLMLGKQEIEGLCSIAGKEYLFECKKVFLPRIYELDVMRRLLIDFERCGRTMRGGKGMICTISFNRPIEQSHHYKFEQKIKLFFSTFNSFSGGIKKIDYTHEDKYGTFRAVDYDEATLIEKRDLESHDVLFYIIPPPFPVEGHPDIYRGRISSKFIVDQSAIYKKLETTLKSARKQHKQSPFKRQVIFLDSESVPDFQMGLFQTDSSFKYESVKKIYDNVGLRSILIILRRNYWDKIPSLHVDVWHSPEDSGDAQYLKTLLLKRHNQLLQTQ